MKRIANKSIPILADFKKWVENRLKNESGKPAGTAGNYCAWLKNIPEDLELEDPFDDYLRIIGSFVLCGDRYCALAFVDLICKEFKDYINDIIKAKNQTIPDKLSNDQSALNKYHEFLFNGINYNKPFIECTGVVYEYNDDKLNKARKKINKGAATSIDSMRSLLAVLGEKRFIKMAIENSFFFSSRINNSRFGLIQTLDTLPVRWSNDGRLVDLDDDSIEDSTIMFYYGENNYSHKVKIDGGPKKRNGETFRKRDENRQVRELINSYTGYVLTGEYPIFQNYIISHVWGNATDPRYYTNFWNVVLVPAWANFLLDKNQKNKSEDGNERSIKGSTSSKLKATFMAICEKLYSMDEMKWSDLNMSKPIITNPDDIQQDTYNIQLINEKKWKNGLGLISVEEKEIRKT